MRTNEFVSKIFNRMYRLFERFINQRHCYDYSPTCHGVVKYPSSVLGDRDTGSMFDPCVVRLPDSSYAMFVSCRKNGTIERWDSRDGISWSRTCTALQANDDCSSWDSVVNRAWVLRDRTVWHMWFTGQHEGKSSIGHATSVDGLVFARTSFQPVLSPELGIEGVAVMNPCVLRVRDGFRMWYSAGDNYEPDVICEARSVDGITWTKSDYPVISQGCDCFDQFKVGGCSVLPLDGDQLVMFYIGYQNIDVARICLAISCDDGRSWRRANSNPIISPEKGCWDAHAVYKPSALLDNGRCVSIWYNARKNAAEYIGLATIPDISVYLN